MTKIDFDAVALTQALVKCPSITPKDEGALKIVEDHLNEIGFKCNRLIFSDKDTPDVDNLFGIIGSSGKNLAFAGHTDVVPIGNFNSWTDPPFSAKIVNDKLYGRGVEDMKGGVACFISATKSFIKKYGTNFGGQISFIITGDEEKEAINGTIKIMQWAQEKKIKFNHCIVGEPTSNKYVGDKIKIGRRGSVNFFITIKGIQGHTANANRSENPIHHLLNLLNKIISSPLDNGNKYFLPSSIQIPTFDVGNPAANVIPEIAKATINIRFNDNHTSKSLEEWLKNHLNELSNNSPKLECSFITDQTGESFITQPGELSVLVSSACKEINKTETNPELATDGGTSDARFIKNYCEVLELGLINNTLHQVNENTPTKDLRKLHDIYLLILEKYFNKIQ